GLPTDKFTFLGFLPRKKGPLAMLLQQCSTAPGITYIAFESPHRLLRSLQNFTEVYGNAVQISVGRELTKLHEEITKGTPEELIETLGSKRIRGELTLTWRAA
ncbi:rRNA (cytidine-2'-O-)-methyltransferase, partial [Candidatus Parcubacteria bacterium]|nr:rRNA (cytidine-2'-O-)-methyltransferase [Candidatus Parcubacteria bacterium]